MQHSQDDHPVLGNVKNTSVTSKQQMPIGRAKHTIFGNIWATLGELFQGFDVFFQVSDKARRGFRVVLGDVLPNLGDIRLSGRRDLNPVFFGHA